MISLGDSRGLRTLCPPPRASVTRRQCGWKAFQKSSTAQNSLSKLMGDVSLVFSYQKEYPFYLGEASHIPN